MFLKAEAALRLEGLSFRDVVRTWICLADIDRDYAALNGVRRQFFTSRGLDPPPTSTGMGGIPDPPDRACGPALQAIARGGTVVRPVRLPSMCEAPSYESGLGGKTCRVRQLLRPVLNKTMRTAMGSGKRCLWKQMSEQPPRSRRWR